MIRKINEAIKYLEKYIPTPDRKHPGEVGIRRMKYFISLLGNPQFTCPIIHVGGTSGKGSTVTMIASILGTKYKVGLCTSPHLAKINERIKINGKDIPDDEFVSVLTEMKPFIYQVEKSSFGKPTYFEILTAMTFLYFKQKDVDYAVIEVGMGGRFDGTNVVRSDVAVLTNVGLDHTEVLGSTVEEIAKDKVGIIKNGLKVVSGAKQPSVIDIIKAKSQNAKISLLGKDFSYRVKKLDIHGSIFDFHGDSILKNLKITMLGRHQIENACLAIRVIELINAIITREDIKKGLLAAYIPARLEVVSKRPLVILDGAHNEDKMEAVASAMDAIFPQKRIIAIVAIKKDKDAKAILQKLAKVADVFIFTQFTITYDLGKIMSFPCKNLGEFVRKIDPKKEIIIERQPKAAIKKAYKIVGDDGLILITGSLYLVGQIVGSV
jgi:dihydrofolate synthase/folylpolyglutamate synthase